MTKVAVICAPGCEEGETLTIVDILRRAEIACDMVGLGALEIAGTHHIAMRCDTTFDGSLDAYDMVVLPGGYGGSDAMRDCEELLERFEDLLRISPTVRKREYFRESVRDRIQAMESIGEVEIKEGKLYRIRNGHEKERTAP